MPTISPSLLGFIRGALYTIIGALLAYVADPTHLTFLSGSMGLVVAGIAGALDHYIEAQTGSAAFGTIRTARSQP